MNDFDIFYTKALRYLSIRFRSEKEMRDYLKKTLRLAQGGNGLIDLVIHKLKQQKFLNDEQFAVSWIRSRTEFRPKGERLIRLELQQKGLNKEIIEKAFTDFNSGRVENNEEKRDEFNLAKEILEKRRKKFENMDKKERFNKTGSLLARRGFDLDTIKKAIDDVFGR